MRHQLGARVGRQLVGEALREAAHDVVHDAAAQRRIGVGAEQRQLFELQDIAGEDLVRVLQPGFDARDAHLARAQLERRARLGRADARAALRVVAHARPAEPRLIGLQGVGDAEAGEQRLQPHQPARRHGRHAVDLLGARDVDAFGAEQRGEIVRRVADFLLGRGQAQLLAHRAVEPWPGIGGFRPRAVVERAEDDDVGLLQARFERPPDGEARMHGDARAHVLADDEAAVEIGVVAGGDLQRRQLRIDEAGEERRGRGAGFALPQRRAGFGLVPPRAARQSASAAATCAAAIVCSGCSPLCGEDGEQRREGGLQPRDEIFARARQSSGQRRSTARWRRCLALTALLGARQRCGDAVEAVAEIDVAEGGDLQRARGAARGERRRARGASADASAAP